MRDIMHSYLVPCQLQIGPRHIEGMSQRRSDSLESIFDLFIWCMHFYLILLQDFLLLIFISYFFPTQFYLVLAYSNSSFMTSLVELWLTFISLQSAEREKGNLLEECRGMPQNSRVGKDQIQLLKSREDPYLLDSEYL